MWSIFEPNANQASVISESGLYKLIMRSDKPQAKAFQDWVTKEVLPSIRKTGSFVTGQPSLVENPQMSALELAGQLTASRRAFQNARYPVSGNLLYLFAYTTNKGLFTTPCHVAEWRLS